MFIGRKGILGQSNLKRMKINEIFKKVDKILGENEEIPSLSDLKKGKKKAKSVLQKLFSLFKKIFYTQYAIITSYLKEELKIAFKNDLKLLVIIVALLLLTVVVFAVFWLFISIALSAYFYEAGNTILHSVMLTMGIHMIVM